MERVFELIRFESDVDLIELGLDCDLTRVRLSICFVVVVAIVVILVFSVDSEIQVDSNRIKTTNR